MRTAICTLESFSPYSQSRHYSTPKEPKESPADYEKRTWRDRMHVTPEGFVFIPPMAFKNCVTEAAQYLGMKIKGGGAKTYVKHFEAGVLVTDPLVLSVKAGDVPGQWLFLPSDGKRGGGKRVDKCFGVIQKWAGDVTFFILDDTITKEVFEEHLEQAGKFIGIGFFRPRRNGYWGRFTVGKVVWK